MAHSPKLPPAPPRGDAPFLVPQYVRRYYRGAEQADAPAVFYALEAAGYEVEQVQKRNGVFVIAATPSPAQANLLRGAIDAIFGDRYLISTKRLPE